MLKMYRDLAVIREMESEARKLYLSKTIRGFCHLYIGQVLNHNYLNDWYSMILSAICLPLMRSFCFIHMYENWPYNIDLTYIK